MASFVIFKMESNTSTRMNKGIFSPNEDAQLCHSLHVSQDQITNNGKKKVALWDYIIEHYNQNHSIGLCERLARSLEPKWGIRKHDVSKFTINHSIVQTLPKSETLIKYATDKFFNSINPSTHNILFYFFPHCWLLSCKVPC